MAKIRTLRRDMKRLRRKGLKWQEIADHYGVTVGMAYRIAIDGHEPKDPHIRIRLGLPAMVQTPVCEKCGKCISAKFARLKRRPGAGRSGGCLI